MNIDINSANVQLVSMGGVWRILLPMSAMSAKERGSELIESIDLIKAIYIVDLEHVAMFWNDWRNYENVISDIPLVNGIKSNYINRTQKMLQLHMLGHEVPGQMIFLATPSPLLQTIAFSARKLAQNRSGEQELPSSCDFLYCACQNDPALSELLQQSGLHVDKLGSAVRSKLHD